MSQLVRVLYAARYTYVNTDDGMSVCGVMWFQCVAAGASESAFVSGRGQ